MSDKPDPSSRGPNDPAANGAETDWKAECEKLQQRIGEVEKERDEYRRALYSYARSLFTEEEMRAIPDEKDCLPLEEFLSELEEAIRRP